MELLFWFLVEFFEVDFIVVDEVSIYFEELFNLWGLIFIGYEYCIFRVLKYEFVLSMIE